MCVRSIIQNSIFKKSSFFDKLIIVYLSFLSLFLIYIFYLNSLSPDEGTHLLLSVFYKDLISHLIETRDFSFNNAYDYGIKYLTTYPKLQIAYPPLYHLSNVIIFSIFGISIFAGRLVNLIYTIMALLIFYLIVKKISNPKIAFISTFLFSFSPISIYSASSVTMDFSVFFWLLLSVYMFIRSIKEKKGKFFFLTGILVFLATLSKQMGGMIIFFFSLVLLNGVLYKRKARSQNLKFMIILILSFSLPLLPYLFILNKVGGFEINKMVAIGYASTSGEPTSLLDPMFWLYYFYTVMNLGNVNSFIFLPLFLFSFIFYIYNKNPYWKKILLFFLVFYIGLSLIPNKEPRFSQYFLLPSFFTLGYYLSKTKKSLVSLFLILYVITTLYVFLPTINYYPVEFVANYIYENISENGNVATFSDIDPLHSSVVMWHLSQLDEDRKIRVYRTCVFDGKEKEEILELLKNNNIYFVIYSTWSKNNQIEKIKDNLTLINKVNSNGLTTEIYAVDNFRYDPNKKICNYICLTKQTICT